MDINKVICIKAGSHSDFELYLIGEKYGIPYDFLSEYKNDIGVIKFWTEIDSGKILAIEAANEQGIKKIEAIDDLSEKEKKELKSVKPIKPGQEIAEYKGSIEDKKAEFADYIAEREAYRKEMLGRKYDHKNIVCISANSTEEQIFAACAGNDIEFLLVIDFIKGNLHIDLSLVWFEKGTSDLVAYSYIYEATEWFEITPGCLIPQSAINKMARKPVVSKIKTTLDAITKYVAYKAMGYDLEIPKFDRLIESGYLTDSVEYTEDIISDAFTAEELQELLEKAVEDEDYESAAFLRDEINRLKNQ